MLLNVHQHTHYDYSYYDQVLQKCTIVSWIIIKTEECYINLFQMAFTPIIPRTQIHVSLFIPSYQCTRGLRFRRVQDHARLPSDSRNRRMHGDERRMEINAPCTRWKKGITELMARIIGSNSCKNNGCLVEGHEFSQISIQSIQARARDSLRLNLLAGVADL